MYIKSIGYVFLLVNLIMAFNFCGFSSQSSYEEMFYAELLTKHEKLQIITANFNSYDPPDLQELQFAQNILDKNYTYYEFEDDLEEINQEKMGKEISFLDKIVPEFKKIIALRTIVRIFESLSLTTFF